MAWGCGRSVRRCGVAAALLFGSEADGAETRHVPVGPGEVLHVVDHGSGPPVVLLPGALGTAFGFRKLHEPLAASGLRALAVELLGQGESTRPPAADYSLTAQAERVRAVLDGLELERAVVVGQGLGVSVALRLAARHPGRVIAVVAIDGGPAESACSPSLRRALRFAPLVKLFGGRRWLRDNVRERLADSSADPSWVTPEVVDGYLGRAAEDVDEALATHRLFARAREPEALRDRLRDVRCPVVLLVGSVRQDAGVRPDEVALLRRELERFEAKTVPGAGHFIGEEAPAAVAAAVVSLALAAGGDSVRVAAAAP